MTVTQMTSRKQTTAPAKCKSSGVSGELPKAGQTKPAALASAPLPSRPNNLEVVLQTKANGQQETGSEAAGRVVVNSAVSAGAGMRLYRDQVGDNVDLMATIREVQRVTDAVRAGDLSDLEAMLVGQAMALQTISANLAERAARQTQQRNLEAFLGLSFKAQAQSRATVQALVDLKFPRQVVFAKNVANLNSGQQQINTGGPSRERKAKPAQIKQLGVSDGEWLDTGTARKAVRTNPQLATVGEVDRSEKRARKVARVG